MDTILHKIGQTEEGFEVYCYYEKLPFAYYLDSDGNAVLLPQATEALDRCAQSYRQEFPGEELDPEWSETAYADLPSTEQAWLSWREFHDLLAARL